MNIYSITAVHIEKNQLVKIKGYMSSMDLALFFPPGQFPFEFSRNEIIALIRQGNIFDKRPGTGKSIPLNLNKEKNTVNLDISQFKDLPEF